MGRKITCERRAEEIGIHHHRYRVYSILLKDLRLVIGSERVHGQITKNEYDSDDLGVLDRGVVALVQLECDRP